MSNVLARKKPVTVNAYQFTGQDVIDWPEWMQNAFKQNLIFDVEFFGEMRRGIMPKLSIRTLEGDHLCRFTDWVIQGVQGELYPCKHEIFELTYDIVEARQQTGGAV